MDLVKWSYSSFSEFKLCPKKYYHSRVAKDIPFEQTDAMRYGNYVHEAIEKYVMEGKELPENISQFKPVVDSLIDIPGIKTAEEKVGFTLDMQPCGFWDRNVWYRGKIDYLVRGMGGAGFMVDWKTGANPRFADVSELDLFAVAAFVKYPEIQTINACLVFLVTGDVIPREYNRDAIPDILMKHIPDVHRLQSAHDGGTWNATPNFTCRQYCKVSSCQFYQK